VKTSSLLDYPQVKPIDAVIASFVVEMLLLIIAAIVIFSTLFWFLGFSPEIPNPLEVVGVMVILFSAGFGLALTFAVLGSFDEGTFSIVRMCMRPMIFVSAVFYGASQIPPAAMSVLRWNPLLQLIEHFRHYFLGVDLFAYADLVFPAYFAFGILVFSFIFYYRNRYKILQR
jgi:capsular polysaccharide transport system permease protein